MQLERLTWGIIRPTVERVLNMCSGDERALDYVNRAVQRLLEEGKWVGTIGRYRICASNGCVVWPRQIETIEAFATDCGSNQIRNYWWEFIGNGPYLTDGCNGWCNASGLIPRDDVASFDNVIGSNKKLAVYCDVTEAANASIILQFYDNNAQWVRTQVAGAWIDGETITFGAAGMYVLSSKFVMANGYVRAIKPVTNGTVRLYEYDTVNLTYRPLAYYEPDETIPVYTRSMIPGLTISESDDCQKQSVTVIAKKRFIPVAKDNDFLLISHTEAIRMAVQSIWKSENNMPGEAALYMHGGVDPVTRNRIEGAIPLLQKQLAHYTGDGQTPAIRVMSRRIWGGGGLKVIQ